MTALIRQTALFASFLNYVLNGMGAPVRQLPLDLEKQRYPFFLLRATCDFFRTHGRARLGGTSRPPIICPRPHNPLSPFVIKANIRSEFSSRFLVYARTLFLSGSLWKRE